MKSEKNTDVSVSIITPLYNAEKYIAETIESVIKQTFTNWEMLIVDDCSTDESRNIVKKYENVDFRIKLIKLETNFGGPAKPRNVGIKKSKGKYIAFLDADDVWSPEKLEKQIQVLENNTDIDIIHTLAYTIDTKSRKIGTFNNQKTLNKLRYIISDKNILLISNYININTVLMKNYSDIKFRENKFLVALEDWSFWIDNDFLDRKSYLLKDYLINYRIDINSISDRRTNKSYKKAFYMYSLFLNEGKISLTQYFFNVLVNSVKIIMKSIKNI